MNLTECTCDPKKPATICWYCTQKGVRLLDRMKPDPEAPTVFGIPKVIDVRAINSKLLRYKAQGLLDCTCRKDKFNCPTHGEFYGTKSRPTDQPQG